MLDVKLEDLLLAVESEPKVLTIAVAALGNFPYFTAESIRQDISGRIKNKDILPRREAFIGSVEELRDQGVVERIEDDSQLDLHGQPHKRTKVYKFADEAEIYKKAALLTLMFMRDFNIGVYSFLGRWNRPAEDARGRMEKWCRALNKLKNARRVNEIDMVKYQTISAIGECSKLPRPTLYKRLCDLEEQGYVRLVLQSSEVGRFRKGVSDILQKQAPNSTGNNAEHNGLYKDMFRVLACNGWIGGRLVLRNDIYAKMRSHKKIAVERLITYLKELGYYNKVHPDRHTEVQITVQGGPIFDYFLEPMNGLRTYEAERVRSRIARYMNNNPPYVNSAVEVALSLYRAANPNIRVS